jgi:hypothetical protein
MRYTIRTTLLLLYINGIFLFNAVGQQYGAVVINELMIDPSPQVGLPNAEWVELKNMGASAVNLQGWRIGDASGISVPMPSFSLLPDSFVIICSSGNVANLSSYGKTISVTSFPSLDNDADLIYIKAANGLSVHAINYKLSYYHNPVKKDGGWSLEMIDPSYYCAGENNWQASIASIGGSPGRKNSCAGNRIELTYPRLIRSFVNDSSTLTLFFDQSVDSLTASKFVNYQLSGGYLITNVSVKPPLFQEIMLKLNQPLLKDSIIQINVRNINDCKGNTASTAQMVRAGLCSEALPGDWVINEVLFNPYSGGYDFVEFYNNSSKCLNAEKIFLGGRNTTGSINGLIALKNYPYTIFPGEYIVVTENATNLSLYYITGKKENIFELPSLPSMPDDEGDILTMSTSGITLDELHYKDDWHYKLLGNSEGVSLERINPNSKTQDASNWQSSAASIGFATPGYKNSQLMERTIESSAINVNPTVFSPDFDGIDDVAIISYNLNNTNYSAKLSVYSQDGTPVKLIANHETVGASGQWKWDGLSEKGIAVPVGIYIIAGEFYSTTGAVIPVKLPVILARKKH